MQADTDTSGPGRELLTVPQTSKFLHVPENTMAQWRWRRTGPPFVKAGARVLYRRADLERWLDANTVATEADR